MKNMKNKSFLLLVGMIAICASMFISACNKKFDEPPVPTTTLTELGIKPNITIKNTGKTILISCHIVFCSFTC